MTAEYFYNKMKEYNNGLNMISIRHKGDNYMYFVIFGDGVVLKTFVNEFAEPEILKVSLLEGDDFELFNTVNIIKSGYLCLNTNSDKEVKDVLLKLFSYIDSCKKSSSEDAVVPNICGRVKEREELVDRFQCFSTNRVELDIHTVGYLDKMNLDRKFFNLKCIPIIEDDRINSKSAIHVNFVHDLEFTEIEDALKRCEVALVELLKFMRDIGVDCNWVESKFEDSFYVYL